MQHTNSSLPFGIMFLREVVSTLILKIGYIQGGGRQLSI